MSKFLAGVITGLVAGILLAPDKGQNTRQNLANTADKWRGKLNDLVGGTRVKMDDLRDYLEQDIEGLPENVRNRILTILEEAEEMAYNPATTAGTISNGTV